jgi:hypothetical protein
MLRICANVAALLPDTIRPQDRDTWRDRPDLNALLDLKALRWPRLGMSFAPYFATE